MSSVLTDGADERIGTIDAGEQKPPAERFGRNRHMPEYTIRDLKTVDECRKVVELEKIVWGYSDAEDVVPVAILIVSVKRGGILLGAFDRAGTMAGFVYSLAAMKDGAATQWSHMLGVLPEARDGGLGAALKLEQRRRAMAMGIRLIEWTFDPLQALNAHLNFAKLGVLSQEFVENVYGDSSSPLHQGTPTDRLIAEWQLDAPEVERRIARPLSTVRSSADADAPVVNVTSEGTRWLACESVDLNRTEPRLLVEIPLGFSEMLSQDPELALDWRMKTRDAFATYLFRGYRVVDFFLERPSGRGRYLLTR
jgi:predicted GNAT superfamily acetyltransferase